MTKSTITRERLQEIAEDGFLKHGESKALAGMVLAAMGGDPVEWINGCNKSVPAALRYLAENPRPIGGESSFNTAHLYQLAREVEFMAEAPLYRHAQPAPEHPEVLPCSVLLEPGLRFGKGIKTSTMLAALARRAVHESDMAALSPEERAEFQAGIEDFKSLIAQQPVVPDEKPMPNSLSMYAVDAVAAIAEVKGWNACRAAMLAAAPQSPGSEPATVPGKCIPVSEQKPDCWCLTCRPVVLNDMRFVVCPDCGNKRCPRANDHRNACTGSNEPGQEGSAYPDTSREVK
ncbi:hypothetical protein AAHW96_18730 [Klebsiella quasipneumoniae subsp. similipneumoniae]|uniref:hypothetical protein n=1 Tax=Klebsiella pneumoniae complex TaxID=3390273 RepID=UPI000E03FA03|nr:MULTISPECIES: hypothetical protein [Klebsiella]STR08130.1 Eaa1 [Klebsiella quasipneumoniae]